MNFMFKKQEMLSDCNREFVMLTEQVKHNRWDKLQYVQAHEMLHVLTGDLDSLARCRWVTEDEVQKAEEVLVCKLTSIIRSLIKD